MQCNPPQPRAKHTTPPDVNIVTWHHAHNNFIFPHDTIFDTQTTMRFCICVLEHSKANCDYKITRSKYDKIYDKEKKLDLMYKD